MKRFTKIMLIISTVFMILGIALMLGTGLLDDLYYGNEELNIGPVGIRIKEAAEFVEHGEEWLGHEFASVIKADEEYHDVRLAGNEVHELEIDVKAASLEIVRDERIDGIAIVEGSKLLDVYHSVDENTLCLDIKKKGKYESINNVEDAKLILRIPAHMEFEELDINLNAGALEADQLDAKELSLNLNASAAEIQELNVGVLDVENNAGALRAYGTIGEMLEVDCNAGATEIQIKGAYADFNYEMNCNVGAIRIGDEEYSGLKSAVSMKQEKARKNMDLDCGAGEIDIQFEKE